jgi:abortive infection bacteriophage resistance protein
MPPQIWVKENPDKTKVFASICILVHLLDICAPQYPFKTKMCELLKRTSQNQREMMGIPDNWMEQPLFMTDQCIFNP